MTNQYLIIVKVVKPDYKVNGAKEMKKALISD